MAEAAGEDPAMPATNRGKDSDSPSPVAAAKKQSSGFLSRIWRMVFGSKNEDYEKKLQHLSKEETAVHARMKRRALTSRKLARNIIVVSATIEVSRFFSIF